MGIMAIAADERVAGVKVTRDIFLYPNVQFVPDQLRSKQTNVALSTNINMF